MRPFKSRASEQGVEFAALDAAIATNLRELGYGG